MCRRRGTKKENLMDVGLLLIATTRTGDLAAIARRTEAAGFESLWIPEHPVIPIEISTPFPFASGLPEHYGRWLDPFIALTVAACATTRLRLVTGICLLPEREPLLTAKVIASLDQCSGGRVVLGVGAGWLREETEVMGTRFGTRWQRLRETVEAMRALWTEGAARYDGALVRFPAVRCEPKPVQPGGPPVLLGGHGEKVFKRLARTFDGWCPIVESPDAFAAEARVLRDVLRDAGRDPERFQLSPFVDPESDLSPAALATYRAAGATRLVMFSQKSAAEIADGAAPQWIDRTAPVVERARSL
jgi:probable F420-dependent oxidoreductase